MPPHDAERECFARRCQLRTFIRRVSRQAAFAERFEHARHRARRDAKLRSNLPSPGSGSLPLDHLINRFDIIFDCETGQGGVPRL